MEKYDTLAYEEYRDYVLYKELLRRESSPEFRIILEKIVEHQSQHYRFWSKLSTKKEFSVPYAYLLLFIATRKLLGLTFLLRFLESEEKHAIEKYKEILKQVHGSMREEIERIIEQETRHEKELIDQIKEEKVAFISSIVLGFNDGLIELTGTMVGFSFALQNPTVIASSGLIAGIAAGMSMASAAYMQARHEVGKNAKKAGIYTGVSYLIVVGLLVAPFFVIAKTISALVVMFIIAFVIIILISYYTAIIFERSFSRQFSEILFFSIGTSIVSFIIGSIFQSIIGAKVK